MQGVERVNVQHPGEAWPMGDQFIHEYGMTLGEKRIMEAIARIRSGPLYVTPVLETTQPPPAQTNASPPIGNGQRQPAPASQARRNAKPAPSKEKGGSKG